MNVTSMTFIWPCLIWKSYVCYASLGCFYKWSPYNNANGCLPHSPSSIQTKFRLYTRSNSHSAQELILTDVVSTIQASNFAGSKKTKFIIHGYKDNEGTGWMKTMKDALLTQEDVNVITVDWRNGADQSNYNQAAANTRVVGAQIAQLIKALNNYRGAQYHETHLIGHSLGAHIAGYAGDRISALGRISGLDAASMSFENYDKKVRLDAEDAMFVDVIHTNGKPFIQGGYGIAIRLGHADFYPNGGRHQPGCPFGLSDLACSHMRSIALFTESIITTTCHFTAPPCSSESDYNQGLCTCAGSNCGRMGYYADLGNRNGRFELETHSSSPYCVDE